ncbi:MAG TPA: 4'-phosphopantetheinyl transferase superfamily protein [Pyrinomonadaceae bacterium]|nr:4'-phosphopantetheinyl transferase superfamily protein [Pyrinomonadaceae bacterium]
MDGVGWVLIGLGHDIQQVTEMENAEALRQPDLFFTRREIDNCRLQTDFVQSLAASFSAKEAFFKASPPLVDFFWTDVEVMRDRHGKPLYCLGGLVGRIFSEAGWRATLSISHSGDYVSVVALITDSGSI